MQLGHDGQVITVIAFSDDFCRSLLLHLNNTIIPWEYLKAWVMTIWDDNDYPLH